MPTPQIKIAANKVTIQLGDGADPETFAPLCSLMSSKSISRTANTSESRNYDCEDPAGSIPTTNVTVNAITTSVSGSGDVHSPNLAVIEGWFNSGEARNIRYIIGDVSANSGGYYGGAFKITEYSPSAEEDGYASISLSLQADGDVVYVEHTGA